MPKPTVPPSVGPHNGRELELMLQGDKSMALFAAEPGMDADILAMQALHRLSTKAAS